MEDLARWSDFDTNLFKSRGGRRELLIPSRLLFYANLISNLQRRYLREIISKVCFFRGIYFPFSLSPPLVKFIAAGEFFLLLLLLLPLIVKRGAS